MVFDPLAIDEAIEHLHIHFKHSFGWGKGTLFADVEIKYENGVSITIIPNVRFITLLYGGEESEYFKFNSLISLS